MEKEDKELLIKDLCGRFPYKVMCEISDGKTTITEVLKIGGLSGILNDTLRVKPYLRSISKMTEEEWEDWKSKFKMPLGAGVSSKSFKVYNYVVSSFGYTVDISLNEIADMIAWLNSHYFDFRGLIEKGLALEAPETMYVHFEDMKTDIEVTKK